MNKSHKRFLGLGIIAVLLVALVLSSTAIAQELLTVTYMQSGTYDKAAEELATSFQAETGISVNVVSFP
jgi:spermidine/putrescine-binding protein